MRRQASLNPGVKKLQAVIRGNGSSRLEAFALAGRWPLLGHGCGVTTAGSRHVEVFVCAVQYAAWPLLVGLSVGRHCRGRYFLLDSPYRGSSRSAWFLRPIHFR
jgi:hypothetical protein